MKGLTFALVLVGGIQAIVTILAFYRSVYEGEGLVSAVVALVAAFVLIFFVLYKTRSAWENLFKKN